MVEALAQLAAALKARGGSAQAFLDAAVDQAELVWGAAKVAEARRVTEQAAKGEAN